MKKIFSLFVILFSVFSFAQKNPDLQNLVKISEIYSKAGMKKGKAYKDSLNELRTSNLAHLVDAFIAVAEADQKLLTKEFLSKPSEKELKYWYIIKEIHFNNRSENKNPRPNIEIALEVLEKEIDSRNLLNNYYASIMNGVKMIFNEVDLSSKNFNLNEYGLKNDTEKAILFFNLSQALVVRFRVLDIMNNYKELLNYADKLPTFNGVEYYKYASFTFEDFEFIGYDKKEFYKENELKKYYMTLFVHFKALSEQNKIEEARSIYFNSILYKPEYFKYSGEMKEILQELYNGTK
ncbi:hypothetical protein [Aureivirga marina]|uniref:hypothetical protein n=1 Tax=Aureivirga marina TaxID=1182451 RepID=UPI0018C9CBB6|nr:hypothetical protein [Aureivirga marina]